MIDYNT